MELTLFLHLALALGLGLLVGLERQWATDEVAGIRTFPLIAVLGVLAAALAAPFGGWVVAAAMVALAAMIVTGNLARLRRRDEEPDPGITTEVAALVMFAVGAVSVAGHPGVAVVVGGATAILLYWKEPLHGFAERLGRGDFRAIIRLTLIALVILPVLPDRAYGPYDVLNPFQIWLMVVLIVGISLAAYVAYKLLGARGGTLAGGLLGGLISSTAATISYARRSRGEAGAAAGAAVMIQIASTIVFARVLVEVAVVAPGAFGGVALPLVAMMLWMAVIAAAAFVAARRRLEPAAGEEPPTELAAAILFGLLYAAVLLAVAWGEERFGERGLYAVAGISGLTDMDAITLSTAQLTRAGRLEEATAWRLILVGGMANLLFKGAAVAVLGSPRLLLRVAVLFGLSLAGGALLLAAWPG